MDRPLSAATQDLLRPSPLRVGLWTCAWILLLGTASLAFDVAFPGPVTILSLGDATSALTVPWEGTDNEYLVAGNSAGFISLVRLLSGDDNFNVLFRQYLGGRLVWLEPWENSDQGTQGVVVASADPDRVTFLEIRSSVPYLEVVHEVDLPEDPGTLVFTGPVLPGGTQLAVSLPGVDRVALLNRQDGQWSLDQILEAGDRPRVLASLDLEDDGVRELISADEGVLSGNLGIFRSDEDGLFERTGPFDVSGLPVAVACHDLDGDGRVELLVGMGDQPTVRVFQAGGGQLVLDQSLPLTLPVQSLHLTDLANGKKGLFAAVRERGLVEYHVHDEGQWQAMKNYYPGCRPRVVTSGDLNGDGWQDLVCLGDDQLPTTVMFGLGDGSFRGFPALALTHSPGASDLKDFNEDGLDDLVLVGADQPVLSFFAGQDDGGLARMPVDQSLGYLGGGLVALEAGGSPGPELALLDFYTGQLKVLDYTGEAGFQELTTRPLLPFPQQLETADLDGDGNDDLFMARRTVSDLLVVFGDGQGGFAGDVTLTISTGAQNAVALDINDDQLLDLVVVDGVSRIYTFLNQGDRTFGGISWVIAGSGARYLGTGDLDGDGDLDLVVGNRNEDSLTLMENTGGGTLVRRITSHAVDGMPLGVMCADLNKTGNTDILVNLGDEGAIGVVFALGDWSYGSVLKFPGGAQISDFRLGDFNLDGYPDVLNLDSSLHLGLTMLNVDPALVAVDPQALVQTCSEDGLAVDVQPDRAGPWVLDLWWNGAWRSMARSGQAVLGQLDFDGRRWVSRVTWPELKAQFGSVAGGQPRLRLTVGEGSAQETLELDLIEPCLPDSAGSLPALLRWDAAPWPNPFNPRVQSRISLARSGRVSAAVFDLAGRRVATLLEDHLEAGTHTLAWDGQVEGRPAAGGVYFLKIEGPGAVLSRKILLLK